MRLAEERADAVFCYHAAEVSTSAVYVDAGITFHCDSFQGDDGTCASRSDIRVAAHVNLRIPLHNDLQVFDGRHEDVLFAVKSDVPLGRYADGRPGGPLGNGERLVFVDFNGDTVLSIDAILVIFRRCRRGLFAGRFVGQFSGSGKGFMGEIRDLLRGVMHGPDDHGAPRIAVKGEPYPHMISNIYGRKVAVVDSCPDG